MVLTLEKLSLDLSSSAFGILLVSVSSNRKSGKNKLQYLQLTNRLVFDHLGFWTDG